MTLFRCLKGAPLFVFCFVLLGFDQVANEFIRILDGVELSEGSRFEVSVPLHLDGALFGRAIYISADEVKLSAPIYVYNKTLIIETRRLIFEGAGMIGSFPPGFVPGAPELRKPIPKGNDGSLDSALMYAEGTEKIKRFVPASRYSPEFKNKTKTPRELKEEYEANKKVLIGGPKQNILVNAQGFYIHHPVTGADLADPQTHEYRMNKDNIKDPTGYFVSFYYETHANGEYKFDPVSSDPKNSLVALQTEVIHYEVRGETGKTSEETYSAADLENWGRGVAGKAGLDAGRLELYIGQIEGPLKIVGSGQAGGQGGRGAKGGNGGAGGKGADGKRKVFGFGGLEPTRGGFGGKGGQGGRGGSGGRGGRGMDVFIYSANEVELSQVDISGGGGGLAGLGGDAGDGGDFGRGGTRGADWKSFDSPEQAPDGLKGADGIPGAVGVAGLAGEGGAKKIHSLKDLEALRRNAVQMWKAFHLQRSFWVLAEKTFSFLDDKLIESPLELGRADQPLLNSDSRRLLSASLNSEQKLKSLKESWGYFSKVFDPATLKTEKNLAREIDVPLFKAARAIELALSGLNEKIETSDQVRTLSSTIESINQLRFNSLLSSLAQVGLACANYLSAVNPFIETLKNANNDHSVHLVSRHFEIPACYQVEHFQTNPLDTIEVQPDFGHVLYPEQALKPLLKIEKREIYRDIFKNPFSAWIHSTAFADENSNDQLNLLNGSEWGLATNFQTSLRHMVGAFGSSEAVVPGGVLKALHATWAKSVQKPEQLHLALEVLAESWRAWFKEKSIRDPRADSKFENREKKSL